MALQVAGRVAMLITLAIAALYVPLVGVGVSLLTESLLIPLILAATNCALASRTATYRYRWILAAGFFAGLAALTRGNGIVAGLALMLSSGPEADAIRGGHLGAGHAACGHGTEGSPAEHPAHPAVLSYLAQHPTFLPQAMFWNTIRLLHLQGRRVSRITALTDENLGARWADAAVIAVWLMGSLAMIGTFTTAARRVPRALWIVPLFLWLSVSRVRGRRTRTVRPFRPHRW